MYQSGACFRGAGGAARRVASSASSSASTSPSVQLWWGSRALGHRSSTRSKPLRGEGKSRGGGRSVATNTNRTELRNGGGGITLRPSSPSPPPGRQRRGPRCGSALRRPPGVYRVRTAPRVKSTLRRRPEPKQQERISNIVNEKESEMNSSSRRGSAWWKAQTARATRSEVAFDWEEPRSWAAASGERRRLTRTEWWPPVETGD
jgi:hypothetical protein